jgi:glycosyltransferase involved in cell wall biosynthesis
MVDFYFYFIATMGLFVLVMIFVNYFSKPRGNVLAPLDEITVIISFRNEAAKLEPLIKSLLNQSKLPASIIFVDDHSSDNSNEIIDANISKSKEVSLIHLPEDLKGKKEAIRFAIRNVKTKYCLTIDADTWFDQHFFEQMRIGEHVDMQIRPVVMKGSSLIGHFAGVEHSFFNALNNLLSPIYTLSSSGANLLFKKSTFDELDNFESHRHIASGDDHYLLRDFQSGRAKIVVSDAESDLVFTESTNTLNDYFNQRIRWLGKTKLKATISELFIGLLIAIYLIGGFLIMIHLLIIGRLDLFLFLILGRWIIDSLVFLNYTIPLRQLSHWWRLPFFQITYPILFIFLLLASIFYKPKWKGRSVWNSY